ncbi:MAG: phosphoribosyltransferase [Nitrospirota bacterium]
MFQNRNDAGVQLAERLIQYKERDNVIILALPRGGVVVGYEIAKALKVRLDVLIVRKIGFPGQQELALGAVSETGTLVLNKELVSDNEQVKASLQSEVQRQKQEIARRLTLYREGKTIGKLKNAIVILVDDGIATGATLKAAVKTLKREGLARLIVGLPVGPQDTLTGIEPLVDELICLEIPPYFVAVGNHYHEFAQVTDTEVVELLKESKNFLDH